MAVANGGTTKRSRLSGESSVTTHQVAMPANIQQGNAVLLQIILASGTQTAAITGVTGFVLVKDTVYSGHHHFVYKKEDCGPDDSNDIITVTVSAASRPTLQTVLLTGTPAVSVVDQSASVNGPVGGSLSVTSPTVTTQAPKTAELQFVAAAGNSGLTGWTVPQGLTLVTESYDGASAASAVGGCTFGIIAANFATQAAGATPGGDLWTADVSRLQSAITLSIKEKAATTTAQPSGPATPAAGWSLIGGATNLATALGDTSDATGAETVDNPNGTQPLTIEYTELDSGNIRVFMRGQQWPEATPVLTATLKLLQGTTVIATRTTSFGTTPGDYSFITTTAETSAITDRTQLRATVTYAVP